MDEVTAKARAVYAGRTLILLGGYVNLDVEASAFLDREGLVTYLFTERRGEDPGTLHSSSIFCERGLDLL